MFEALRDAWFRIDRKGEGALESSERTEKTAGVFRELRNEVENRPLSPLHARIESSIR